MNQKLCKRLHKQARDASPVGAPLRGLIADRVMSQRYKAGFAVRAINDPASVRGQYRLLKRAHS